MRYDVLLPLKEELERTCKSPQTAKTYYQAVKNALENQQFDRPGEIDPGKIKESLTAIRSASELSAAKNGLKMLQALYSEVRIPEEEWFQEVQGTKTRRRKTRAEPIQLESIKHKINALKDDRLKLAYRTALNSGLRVSELADLKPGDLQFKEGARIGYVVRRGKGGKPRELVGLPDPYLHERLQQLMTATPPDQRLFYSNSHLRKRAYELEFECHDLRRVNAQDYRRFVRGEGLSAYEANGAVMESLGHTRFRTTARYLRKKVIRGGGSSGSKT